jgi:hypothetical protein
VASGACGRGSGGAAGGVGGAGVVAGAAATGSLGALREHATTSASDNAEMAKLEKFFRMRMGASLHRAACTSRARNRQQRERPHLGSVRI